MALRESAIDTEGSSPIVSASQLSAMPEIKAGQALAAPNSSLMAQSASTRLFHVLCKLSTNASAPPTPLLHILQELVQTEQVPLWLPPPLNNMCDLFCC